MIKKIFKYKILTLLTIILSVVTIDYKSKQYIINNFLLYDTKPIGFLINIFYTQNYGAAFGIFENSCKQQNYFLCIMSIVAILIMLIFIYTSFNNKFFFNLPYVLIVSGAIGNLINRIYYGYVIDFIDFHINNWHFPTFNIADISIFFGSLLLFFHSKKHF